MSEKYAVIDIEATGGTQKVDRIIEIGVVLIDDHEITETFSTLINPGISIPPFITRLTGIDNQMVNKAPEFHEIARTIVEMTEGRSLVAHNVSFDYRILREEFDRLGYEFKSDTLCTARLSKHYFPDIEKYNLASISNALNLSLPDHHRAADDAKVAAEILIKILEKSQAEGVSLKNMSIYKRQSKLPVHIQEEQILDLPNVCGVYYMLDADDQPLYIGKSLKIRSRIRAHFSQENGHSDKMHRLVHRVRYENTGSELMAEVYESLEIRKYKPLLNRAKRKTKYDTALYVTTRDSYPTFQVKHKNRLKKGEEVLQWFSSKNSARAYISGLIDRFDLCACLCGVNSGSGDCTTYKIGKCSGGFLGMESIRDYTVKFEAAREYAGRLFDEDMILLAPGRTEKEKSVFYVSEHRVSHVGYLPQNTDWKNGKLIQEKLETISRNAEIDRIVYRHFYLRKYDERILLNSN